MPDEETPEKGSEEGQQQHSRRDFLRAAGFTAAGLGVGGVAGGLAGEGASQQHPPEIGSPGAGC